MKLAVLLFGISKQNHYKHWHPIIDNRDFIIDYNYSYDNYKKYIFEYFENKGYEIDIYFCSNKLDENDSIDIIKKYNPVKHSFIDNETNIHISRNKKLDKVIDLCLETNNNYDLILITRFDLIFRKNFNESNIILNKFNLVSILDDPNGICDNFYLFPYKYLESFSKVVKKNLFSNFHTIKNDIENINGPEFINYILSENVPIGNLSFYKIVRYERNKGMWDWNSSSPWSTFINKDV